MKAIWQTVVTLVNSADTQTFFSKFEVGALYRIDGSLTTDLMEKASILPQTFSKKIYD
jgi:hypothetical protein